VPFKYGFDKYKTKHLNKTSKMYIEKHIEIKISYFKLAKAYIFI